MYLYYVGSYDDCVAVANQINALFNPLYTMVYTNKLTSYVPFLAKHSQNLIGFGIQGISEEEFNYIYITFEEEDEEII